MNTCSNETFKYKYTASLRNLFIPPLHSILVTKCSLGLYEKNSSTFGLIFFTIFEFSLYFKNSKIFAVIKKSIFFKIFIEYLKNELKKNKFWFFFFLSS